MNRIDPLSDAFKVEPAEHQYSVQLARITSSGRGQSHALFTPIHYEPGYAYPLLVWLHGGGDSEQQLRRVMPSVSMRNYIAVAPRGTMIERRGQRISGYHWQQTLAGIEECEDQVAACIQLAVDNYNIHPRRIFLAGYGCGGTMAMRLALSQPERFAGAASLLGPLPTNHRPLARINQLRGLPFFLAGAAESESYPETQLCLDLHMFHAAGMSLTLRQYPAEYGLTPLMLADLNRWLMEQFCSSSVSA